MNWTQDDFGYYLCTETKGDKTYRARVFRNGVYVLTEYEKNSEDPGSSHHGIENDYKKSMEICEKIIGAEPIKGPEIIVNDYKVTIIIPEGSTVRYTINGKDPKATNKIYKEEFEVEEGTVIKAKAWYENGDISDTIEKKV